MTAIIDRTGDFTKKKYLYKFYKNGYTSRRPKYMAAGQYMGGSGRFIDGGTQGSASMGGSVWEDSINVSGSGDSNLGLHATYRQSTDTKRKFDLAGIILSFAHGSSATSMASVYYYEASIFDYRVRVTTDDNTIKIFYKEEELASATMDSGYSYIRLREVGGKLYFDRSIDGNAWTSWVNRSIDFGSELTKDVLSLELFGGAAGLGSIFATLSEIDASDRHNQLLAVEAKPLSDLEFTETINTPASSTTVVFPYDPLDVPAHFAEGNFVEIYANFYDDGVIKYEPILDHNSEPILDHNSEPIRGVVLHGNLPEESSVLKFSGFIGSIDYDYDSGTIAVTFISHGETMDNSIIRDEQDISTPVMSQLQYNSNITSTSYRQTFTLDKMTKIDDVTLRIAYTGGGSASVLIGRGDTVLAQSRHFSWSGALSETDLKFHFTESVYLEAGQYWIKVTGGVRWYYQNTNVMEGGAQEDLIANNWVNSGTDIYFILWTSQPNYALTLSGNSKEIAETIFARSLELDYSPLFLEYVEETDYSISIGLNLDSAKNAMNALYRQLPTGWYYEIDIGTGAVRIKNKSSNPDHLLVFGRDFTGMKVTKDINGIVNDVFYVGGALIENGPKLTTRTTDIESIADYRHGVSIITNDKVTRYDSAQLLSNHTIGNNNRPRLSTEITVSAAKYNTESIRKGHVVKIVNGDRDVLGATLIVANIDYSPEEVTISLDSAPRNLSRTIDAIQRDLENTNTATASAVV